MRDVATVDLDIDHRVATVWLNRPHRLNAVTPELVADLLTVLGRVSADDGVGAVVLAGRGRAFCSGHDLKQPPPEQESRARLEQLQDVTRALRALPQPVVGAVHGYAIGAGAEFALGCDLVVAADDAVFAFPEVGLGLSVTGAASRLLPLLVGPMRAKELIMLGERIDAASAHAMGLVNRVVPAAELAEHVNGVARTLAERPASALALAKRAIDRGIDGTVEAALELEVSHALITEHTPEVAASKKEFENR
ncbi:enoyl-CoA hydratase/isomerase family protein [Saccharomonospora xinjiangensis]|uniref:Enoyl-CoA hydratase/carnithine racemase n=1 Tax=Saccharomonospora xinjiangensis XJ-54 TaxID=882086 RepID=I0V4D2_9PSEU|nr:enoyl-CoA hydratase-related protein [Saccharomonospora xinjiangensis]EID54985.1 enoyl-CoA hydratase/carnithine racemase [Saccharomonospora xinjiangensis XJ-54]